MVKRRENTEDITGALRTVYRHTFSEKKTQQFTNGSVVPKEQDGDEEDKRLGRISATLYGGSGRESIIFEVQLRATEIIANTRGISFGSAHTFLS